MSAKSAISALLTTVALGAAAWVPQPPLGLDLYLPAPITNPLTREKIALGRQLLFHRDAESGLRSVHELGGPERNDDRVHPSANCKV